MDIAANETSMPSRISVGKEAPSALDFIQRFRNAKGGEIDWSGVNYDTYVRVREMDFDKVEKARPSKPFVNGSPLEYARYMSKFDSTTNRPTFGSKDKLDELALWFGGDAHHIVSTHISSNTDNHDTAFALAKSELDTLSKGSKDTFSAIVRSIVSGKQLAQYDQDGHLHVYADLKKAKAVARFLFSSPLKSNYRNIVFVYSFIPFYVRLCPSVHLTDIIFASFYIEMYFHMT